MYFKYYRIFIPLFLSSALSGPFAHGQVNSTPKLLEPEGPYQVGHIYDDWTDFGRKELGTLDTTDFRLLPVQIFYPAGNTTDLSKSVYRPRIAAYENLWDTKTLDFMKKVQTHHFEAPDVHGDGPFPVFIFSHGWNSRSASYSTLLSNLASYGYIVIGVNHPFLGSIAMPDGQVANADDSHFEDQAAANLFYAQDIQFIIQRLKEINQTPTSQLKGQINSEKIIVGGHSSGFPAVSGAALLESSIKGLISFDSGVPRSVRKQGLDVPIFLFRADTLGYTDLFFRGPNVHPKGTIYDVNFFRIHRADFYDLVIPGSTHNSVFDEYIFAETDAEKILSIKNHSYIGKWIDAFIKSIFNPSDLSLLQSDLCPSCQLRVILAPPK